jgi:hypothetical protein
MSDQNDKPTESDDKKPKEQSLADASCSADGVVDINIKIDFSGTDCTGSPWGRDWLGFTDNEYYHRIRNILLEYGLGEGDAENIIANVWEDGWIRARESGKVES